MLELLAVVLVTGLILTVILGCGYLIAHRGSRDIHRALKHYEADLARERHLSSRRADG